MTWKDALAYAAGIVIGWAIVGLVILGTPSCAKVLGGYCELPPDQHDGYTRTECDTSVQSPTEMWCRYESPECDLVVRTKDCYSWVVEARTCRSTEAPLDQPPSILDPNNPDATKGFLPYLQGIRR